MVMQQRWPCFYACEWLPFGLIVWKLQTVYCWRYWWLQGGVIAGCIASILNALARDHVRTFNLITIWAALSTLAAVHRGPGNAPLSLHFTACAMHWTRGFDDWQEGYFFADKGNKCQSIKITNFALFASFFFLTPSDKFFFLPLLGIIVLADFSTPWLFCVLLIHDAAMF